VVHRAAIVRLSAIGDVVHGLPLARSLRRVHPAAKIAWVVQPEAAPLLSGHPWIDEVLRFPRLGGPFRILRFLAGLSRHRFDLAVDLQGNAKSALVAAATRAGTLLALARTELREAPAGLLPARRARPAEGPHSVDRTLALCRAVGDPLPRAEFGLSPTAAEAEAAARDLAPLGRRIAAFSVGARDDVREWTDEGYVATASALRASAIPVLVLSGPRHAERARRIAAAAGVSVRAGTTDLRGLLAHLSHLALTGGILVAADSAPLHLARAAALPVVALAGPQDPQRTGAYGLAAEAIRAWDGLPCAPCRKRRCTLASEPRACMARIAPGTVVARVREALSGARGPSSS
jgi:ADP-heptose:LPS heptosyltransferase